MDNKYQAVDRYLTQLFQLSDASLDQVLQSIDEHQLVPHSISPVQARLLTQYAHLAKANTMVEIGTLAGYSAIVLARALREGGHLYTIDPDPKCCAVARRNIARAGLEERITVLEGMGMDVLQHTLSHLHTVDLFFMDGDKEHYVEYYEWALARAPLGKLIIADNVLRDGKILDQNSTESKVLGVQRYLKHLAQDTRTHSSVVPMEGEKGYDGMAISLVL